MDVEDLRTFLGATAASSRSFGPRKRWKAGAGRVEGRDLADVLAWSGAESQAGATRTLAGLSTAAGRRVSWRLSTPSDVRSAHSCAGALGAGDALLQPPDALDDKSPTVLMANLLGQPKYSGTALVTNIVEAAYAHPELGENARRVVKRPAARRNSS